MVVEAASENRGMSLLALFVTLAGSAAGPYLLIVAAALAGAMWPLSSMKVTSRLEGAKFLLRVVVTAVFLTGTAAYMLETKLGVPVGHSTAAAALAIGAMGNGWRPVFTAVRHFLVQLLGGNRNGNPPRP